MCEKLSFGFVAWVVCEEPKRQREKVKLVKAPTQLATKKEQVERKAGLFPPWTLDAGETRAENP